MKKIATLAALSTALISSGAFAAATDTQSLSISATVPQECSIAAPSAVTFAQVPVNQSAGQNALLMSANSNNSQFVWTSCNYAASIKVEGSALDNPAGAALAANDADDFTNKINYVLTFEPQAGGSNGAFNKLTLNTRVNQLVSNTPGGAFHENAKLGVTIPSDTANNPKRPVAGTYTATATITLGAI